VYRQIYQLITQHQDLLDQAKPNVSKNSAGYYLWNVWDKDDDTFDLTRLFAGSQGTLGIFTEITFRLITPKPHSQLLVIFLSDLEPLARIIKRVLDFNPESFESYDDHTLRIAMKFLPDLIKQMKATNLVSLMLQFLPEVVMIATGGVPKLILLAEFTGDSKDEVLNRARAAKTALKEFDLKTRLTKSDQEAKKYWTMRRESFNLLRHHVRNKRTAPFVDDIIVRPDQLNDFLPRLNAIMSHYDITYTIAGHAGDANFHIIPLMDVHRPDFAKIISELSTKVYDLVIEFNGSITAEHNDGLIRTPFLEQMYGSEIIGLFAQTKKIFDPQNIFNPGKKVGSSKINWKYAMDHLIKE